ncbi:MAG: hypothetical protein ABI200_05635, partial [Gaiellales bacterium]
LAKQKVSFVRMAGKKQIKLKTVNTNAKGVATIKVDLKIPKASLSSPAKAKAWLKKNTAKVFVSHVASGNVGAADTASVKVKQ